MLQNVGKMVVPNPTKGQKMMPSTDLREDDQTKEELHQRTDVVSDELWEIVEERKEKSIEFRKQIMEAGHVEFNLALLTTNAQQLMQGEVDLFKTEI